MDIFVTSIKCRSCWLDINKKTTPPKKKKTKKKKKRALRPHKIYMPLHKRCFFMYFFVLIFIKCRLRSSFGVKYQVISIGWVSGLAQNKWLFVITAVPLPMIYVSLSISIKTMLPGRLRNIVLYTGNMHWLNTKMFGVTSEYITFVLISISRYWEGEDTWNNSYRKTKMRLSRTPGCTRQAPGVWDRFVPA